MSFINKISSFLTILNRRIKTIINALAKGEFNKLFNLFKCLIVSLIEPLHVNASVTLLVVEPTNRCNLNCVTCINKDLTNKKDLSFEDFKKILDKFPYLVKLSLTGVGEPLLNKDLSMMIKYAREKNIDVGFTTNATLMNKDKTQEILASGVSWISFSLDSPVKNSYEKIRVGSNFETVVQNITYFTALAEKINLNPNILVVVSKENFSELPLFIPLLKEVGIKRLDFQSIHFWGSDGFKDKMTKIIAANDMDLINFIKKIKIDAQENGIQFSFMNLPDLESGRKCKWPWRSCYISVDGFVTPCCLGGADPTKINFGNIFHHDDFNEIWNGKQYVNFRKLLRGKTPPGICLDCPNYYESQLF